MSNQRKDRHRSRRAALKLAAGATTLGTLGWAASAAQDPASTYTPSTGDPTKNGTQFGPKILPSMRESELMKSYPDRILAHLEDLDKEQAGDVRPFPVTRLEHSLQTATLAFRDGRDEEFIVCCLLHDIGELLASFSHGEMAAAVLWPFVNETNHWMVANHHVFQGYYYFDRMGLDRNLREQYRGHPAFEHTLTFCDKYDQPAFDPEMDTMPLSAFEPMARRVLMNPQRGIYVPGSI